MVCPHSLPCLVQVGRIGHLFHQPVRCSWAFLIRALACQLDFPMQAKDGFTALSRMKRHPIGPFLSFRFHGRAGNTCPSPFTRLHAAAPFAPSLQSVSTPSSLLRALLTSRRRSVGLTAHPAPTRVGTPSRPPQISHTPFLARSPTLRSRALISMDFAVFCPLFLPSRLSSRFLFIDPRFCSTLLSDSRLAAVPLRFTTLRPDQAGRETFILRGV